MANTIKITGYKGEELMVENIVSSIERIGDVPRDTVTITKQGLFTNTDLALLSGGPWTVGTHELSHDYTELISSALVLAKPQADSSAKVAELTQTVEVAKEKITDLLRWQDVDTVIEMLDMILPWVMGDYPQGAVRKYNDYPYRVVQAHDSTGKNAWNPKDAPSLWAALHAKSAKTALPYLAPTGAHDIYKVGEYVLWPDDGKIKRCLRDTAHTPEKDPAAWRDAAPGEVD